MKKQFNKYGYQFKQLENIENRVFIYEQLDGDRLAYYEVVIPRKGGYPSSSDWGTHGFTIKSLDRAREKALELLENSGNNASNGLK